MIKHIGLIGAGAVGSVLAQHFMSIDKPHFSIIATGRRADVLSANGLCVNGEKLLPRIISDEPVEPIDLLIIAVKNYNLQEAIRDFSPFINSNTILLPFLNGISVHKQLQSAFPNNRILYGIISKIDAHRTPDGVRYNTSGKMIIGYKNNTDPSADLMSTLDCFRAANLDTFIGEDMEREVWKKWMLNVGANQVSALTGADYLAFSRIPEIRILLQSAMTEVLNLAKAASVNLYPSDINDLLSYLLNYPYPKKTSMLQDIEAHRKTEIDDISKIVLELGTQYNIPTPVNKTLYYAIKAKETAYLLNHLEDTI